MNAEAEIKDYEDIVNATQAKTGKVTTKHFHTIAVIGKGSYGKVLLVVKRDTGQRYALKILKKDEIIKRNQFEHTMAERRILVSNIYPVNLVLVKCKLPLHSENGLRLPI